MARAMHCVTNHDVWSRTSDFASQSLFPLSLISASVGIVNEEKSMSMVVSSPLMLPAASGWRGVSSCDMPIYVSLEPRSKRWKPPIIIKNPWVFDHCRPDNE